MASGRRTAAYAEATGAAFWSGGDWFAEMILAGYKGRPSKSKMRAIRARGEASAAHPSVAAHHSMARDILTRWAQHLLGVAVDGQFGPRSRAALTAWQTARGIPATGELDAATVATLTGPA
jgi:peptidoglycan hydrolase-like protein with peptidoglycan-binding domain